MLALLLAEVIYNKLNPSIMVQYMSTLSIGVPIIEIIGFSVVGVLFICLKWHVFTKNTQSGSRTIAFLYSFVSIMKSFSVNAIMVSIFYSIILMTHTSHLLMHKGMLKFLILNGIVTAYGITLISLVGPLSSIISGIRLSKIKSCY